MLNALYLAETPGQFIELRRMAVMLREERKVEQYFLVYDCQPSMAQFAGEIRMLDALHLNSSLIDVNSSNAGAALRIPEFIRKVLRACRAVVRPVVLAVVYRRLLKDRKISLVVVTEDNVGGRSRQLVAAASRLDIPVLLLPYTFLNPDEAAAALGHIRSHRIRGPMRRLFAALRPRWSYRGLLRLPLSEALVAEAFGLAPKNPWLATGQTAMVAAESAAMMRHYQKLGLSNERLVLTGTLVDAVLESGVANREEFRAALRMRYQLPDLPILLCALPPDQFALKTAGCEFDSYADLLNAWTGALKAASQAFAVVVRPHPRTPESALTRLRQSGLAIAQEDTASLVPLCDVYVAALSATIRWAVACKRPVINYDVYRYRYEDYKEVPGVISVESLYEFSATLAGLASDRTRLPKLAESQSKVAADWGCLDGSSNIRLLRLFDRLAGTASRA